MEPEWHALLQGRESYITTRNSRVIVEFWWVVDEKGVERFKWIGLHIRSDADQFVPYRNMGERKKTNEAARPRNWQWRGVRVFPAVTWDRPIFNLRLAG